MRRLHMFAKMAGKNVIPAIFCTVLFCSFLRLWFENPSAEAETEALPKYIDGFVYRAIWNKNEQLVFIPDGEERILLFCNKIEPELFESMQKGMYIRLEPAIGSVTVPETAVNPGAFDQRQYVAAHSVRLVAFPESQQIRMCSKTEFSKFFRFRTSYLQAATLVRKRLSNALHHVLGTQDAATVMAVMTGDTGGITPENMKHYRNSGIAHVMAVSGMHAGFIQNSVMHLVSRRKIGFPARNFICIIFLLGFACIADFSPSVTRAVLQSFYVLMAKVLKRPYKAKNALCMACILQLAANPNVLYHTGFLLSYTAAASILLIKPALVKRIFFFGKIPDCISTGISVNLGILPLLITYFNTFSPIGIIATIFAAKLAYWICMSGYVIWLTGMLPFGTLLARIPASLCAAALYALNQVSAIGSGIPPPIGAFRVVGMSPQMILLYYVLLFIILNKKYFLFLKRHVLPIMLSAVIGISLQCLASNCTEVLFFDVGQGFSALIRTGKVCGLIDGGDGKTDISSLLFRQGIGRLDFVLLTHGHSDHAEGIYDVLKEHPVKCLLIPDNPYDEGVQAICREAAAQKIEIVRIRGAWESHFGDLYVKLYANEAFMISSESRDVNNSSLVMYAENENGSILFTGDIERETETDFTENQWFTETDVLAVAHHGADSGSEAKNISIISPDYAIISVGRKNRYGHPSKRVTNTLENAGAKLFRSDLCGAVRITMRKGTLHAWQKLKISDPSRIT